MKGPITGFSTAIIVATCALASAQTAADPAAASASRSSSQTAPARATTKSERFSRLDITGIPAGALWVREGDTAAQPRFDSYVPGAAVGVKLTNYLDVEGETAWGIGRRQELKFEDESLGQFKTPTLFGYSGNLVVNLLPSQHRFIPYALGGLGGLHVSRRDDLAVNDDNFLTGDVGGGVKVMWGQIGVRGDYRFLAMHGKDSETSPFVGTDTRYGNRIYAGVVYAPGRRDLN